MFDKLIIFIIKFYYLLKIYRLKIMNLIYWLLIISVYGSIIGCAFYGVHYICGVSLVL